MRGLANNWPGFADTQMLIAASDVAATLKRSTIHKNIDAEWVDRIEEALPYLDLIVRNPTIMIEDVDEILPVELSRNIAEKTIKHLAQHTNMIQAITEKDEVIPLEVPSVDCFFTRDGKVFAILEGTEYSTRLRIKQVLDMVDDSFIKVNQGCVINVRSIQKFTVSIGGALKVVLKNGFSDYVARREVKNIKRRFGL
jgi:DNA-binding LytR/AlgR family response regulator